VIVRLWKLIGLAGILGITTVGAVLVARRRHWRHYDADELRSRLQQRLAEANR
jgi:hypothetical protein